MELEDLQCMVEGIDNNAILDEEKQSKFRRAVGMIGLVAQVTSSKINCIHVCLNLMLPNVINLMFDHTKNPLTSILRTFAIRSSDLKGESHEKFIKVGLMFVFHEFQQTCQQVGKIFRA